MERKITPSEIIFATNFYISDEETVKKYTNYVKEYFSKFYRFTNNDVENLVKMEKLKIDARGKNINCYLFNPKLSLENKLEIIEDFYKNDAFGLFTFSEIFIAFNISWKILWNLKESEKKIKNSAKLEVIKSKINLFEAIIEESFIQTNHICLYNDNCRFMYGDVYMPTDIEENEIKNYTKTLPKN